MPARAGPRSGLTVVSRAPHSLPFAHITCCMRVSFESGRETTSPVGPAPTSSRQQPVPAMVTVVVSFRQKPCGVFMPGGVPEPGCRCLGGTPYWPTGRTWLDRLTAGDAEFSDDVLVIVHATSCCDVRVPTVPEIGFCASSAAFELSKYSVPPLLVLNDPVPGDCAGQTVKPGCVEPVSLGALTSPEVSRCCIVTFAAPAASCAFENA